MMMMLIVWMDFDGISAVSCQRNSDSHDPTSWKRLAAHFSFIASSFLHLRKNFCTKLDETLGGRKTLVVSSHGATQLLLLMRRNTARTLLHILHTVMTMMMMLLMVVSMIRTQTPANKYLNIKKSHSSWHFTQNSGQILKGSGIWVKAS